MRVSKDSRNSDTFDSGSTRGGRDGEVCRGRLGWVSENSEVSSESVTDPLSRGPLGWDSLGG